MGTPKLAAPVGNATPVQPLPLVPVPVPMTPFDGPALLACIQASGYYMQDVIRQSGLSDVHAMEVLHGKRRAGYYAATRLRRACRELGIRLPEDDEVVTNAER